MDNNLINPVEGKQNVIGLTPAKDTEEKKKRYNFDKRRQHKDDTAQDEIIKSEDEKINERTVENGHDKHSVDYCA